MVQRRMNNYNTVKVKSHPVILSITMSALSEGGSCDPFLIEKKGDSLANLMVIMERSGSECAILGAM